MRSLLRALLQFVTAALVVGITLFAIGVGWPLDELEAPRDHSPLAIRNVTVIDLATGARLPDRTVLVRDGRIASVAPSASTPIADGVRIVDGTDRFLIPGLWDMHAHVLAISPLLDLPLFVANGVLNVRDLLGCPREGDPFIACPHDKQRWSQQALDGERVGPRIVSSTSFMANGPTTLARVGGVPSHFGTATAEDAVAFVRHQAAAGADEIKVYDRLPRDAYFALAAEATRLGLPVVGHRPRGVSVVEMASAGQKSLEHARAFLHESYPGSAQLRVAPEADWREDRRAMLNAHDPALAHSMFEALEASGMWYVPTHLTRKVDAYAESDALRNDPRLRYVHPLLQWQWLEDLDGTIAGAPTRAEREIYVAFYRKGLGLTGDAHRTGVRILAGTDTVFTGSDLHRELVELVAAGLSPLDALRAATSSPAEYYGLSASHGRIADGYVADLVLLDADPIVDITNTERIHAVVFGGRLHDRAMLDRILAHVESRARSFAVGCRIVWRFIRSPAQY